MAKKLVWTNSAKISRWKIFEYWNLRIGNTKYSKKLAKEFNSRIDKIKEYPELGKITEMEGIRTTACGHFSIFYQDLPDLIVIVGIYDTRRDPYEIIKEIMNGR